MMKKIFNHKVVIFIFLSAMLALLCFSFYDYNFRNGHRIEHSLKNITKENNAQTNVAISEKLEDQIHILQTYATMIAKEEDITSEAVFQDLKPLLNTGLFVRIAVSDANGISYTSDHLKHDSSQREYFIEGKKGHTYISDRTESVLDNSNVIVMSVPIYQNDQFAGVLRATIDIHQLHEYFELSFLSGNVSSYVIQRDGLNLTLQDQHDYNFLDALAKQGNETKIIQDMRQNMKQGKAGSITFQMDGKMRYAYYSPIPQTQWYMLTILPHTMVQEELDKDFEQTILLAAKISLILILIYTYFFYLQRQGAKEMKKINQRMDAVISNTPGSSYKHEVHKPETIIFFKKDDRLLAGYTREEIQQLIATDIFALIFEEDYKVLIESVQDLQLHTIITNTYRIKSKQNEVLWIYDQRQIVEEDHTFEYYVEVLDITEMKNTQEELMISKERYQMILRETQSVVFEWNIHTDRITFSELWSSKYGYPNVMDDFLILTNRMFRDRSYTYVPLLEAMVSGSSERNQIDCMLPKANGEDIWVRIFAKAITNEQGYLLRIVGSISDISSEREKSMELMERAQKDGLTSVYNRMTLEYLISEELKHNVDHGHIMFVIDIDDFKGVNDTMGHASGDEALIKFAAAVTSSFRKQDLIGRIGGDEFVVLMRYTNHDAKEQIERKCNMLLTAISNIRLKHNQEYRIHCSIGVVVHPMEGTTYQELFVCADKRLYQAKKLGKNTFVYEDKDS